MTVRTGMTSGDIEVDDHYSINGIHDGSVTVLENGTFLLQGVIQGDLTVHQDGIATVRGVVTGTAANHGGELNVYGSIDVDLIENGGNTFVHPDSKIAGVKQSER